MKLAMAQLPLTLALENSQCGDCWCLYDSAKNEECPKYPSWREEYSDGEIAMLRSHKLINPISLPCNPYENSTCNTVPALDEASMALCATKYASDCSTYELRSFSDLGDATAAGFTFTHLGPCGVCSTLQDLASYMANEDMVLPEKGCGALASASEAAAASCFAQTTGMSPTCAQLHAYQAAEILRGPCRDACEKSLNEPYNLEPDCRLNDCLQCTDDGPGVTFMKFAGRTRKNSGIKSAVQRNCSDVFFVDQYTCKPRRQWLQVALGLLAVSGGVFIVTCGTLLWRRRRGSSTTLDLGTSLQPVDA